MVDYRANEPCGVVFLVYDGMNLLDLAGSLQAFFTSSRISESQGGPALYETVVASVDGGTVLSSAGLPFDTQLVMFIKRAGEQSQFSVPLATQARDDGNFAALHSWIAAHLAENLGVERMASQAGMSMRTFVRVYLAKVGRTPAKTVEAMRMEAACRALESTDLPLKAIAMKVGYAEEQNLRRVFLRTLDVSPLQYRARFSERVASSVGPAKSGLKMTGLAG